MCLYLFLQLHSHGSSSFKNALSDLLKIYCAEAAEAAMPASNIEDLSMTSNLIGHSKNVLFLYQKSFILLGTSTVFENHRKSLIASEASYVYILSGQKLIKKYQNSQFGEFLKI